MRRKRFCLLSFLLCMVLLFNISAYAAEMRASSYINSKIVSLSVSRNGDLNIYFYVYSNGTMDTLGASRIEIERYNGTRWIVEHTFTSRNAPEIQTSKDWEHEATLTYTPDYTGTDYRAVVTFYAKDANGSDSIKATSKTVTT